jgi:DNA-binding FadR family transcriptional regulator
LAPVVGVGRRPPRSRGVQRGKKIAEVLAREIIRDAIERRLEPGMRLQSEAEMIERFEVSRGSLREALRILEVQGLLEMRPGRNGGPFLVEVSDRSFGKMSALFFMAKGVTYLEVLEARISLTELMARLAAERSSAKDVQRLQAQIDTAEVEAIGDSEAWVEYTTSFYTTIGELCGNRVVAMSCLAFMSIWVEHLPSPPYTAAYRTKIIATHRGIVEAIEAGDGSTAELRMSKHMKSFKNRFREIYPMFLDEVVDWE